jgi:hypothetical protein
MLIKVSFNKLANITVIISKKTTSEFLLETILKGRYKYLLVKHFPTILFKVVSTKLPKNLSLKLKPLLLTNFLAQIIMALNLAFKKIILKYLEQRIKHSSTFAINNIIKTQKPFVGMAFRQMIAE